MLEDGMEGVFWGEEGGREMIGMCIRQVTPVFRSSCCISYLTSLTSLRSRYGSDSLKSRNNFIFNRSSNRVASEGSPLLSV
jgi:hypothetical protein